MSFGGGASTPVLRVAAASLPRSPGRRDLRSAHGLVEVRVENSSGRRRGNGRSARTAPEKSEALASSCAAQAETGTRRPDRLRASCGVVQRGGKRNPGRFREARRHRNGGLANLCYNRTGRGHFGRGGGGFGRQHVTGEDHRRSGRPVRWAGALQVAAVSGLDVVVFDAFPGAIDKCKGVHKKSLGKFVEKGR